jgi:hypothetical protein
MANSTQVAERGFGVTQRRDSWWAQPLAVACGLGAFVVYSTWAAFQGTNYEWGPYLSPMYSPKITLQWWHLSPAFLILWAPGGFRLTCYYYRKAYYRAFFLDPPACAVGEFGEHRYCGENAFPLKFQNIHRYFMYLALAFLVFLWHDAYKALWFDGKFGIGIGTLVMIANATFLSGYTLGCHSFRHLIGGRRNTFAGGGLQYSCWKNATKLNEHHQLWAWMSLFVVGFTDFYIRMVAMGVFRDIRLI